MAAPTINFAGFVYDDAGDAVSGATIHIYDKNSTSTAREASSITTNSSGYYSYSHATPGEFDVEIVKGTSKRRYKFDDKIHLSEIDVEKLSIRGNEGAIAGLYMYADEGDDASDQWLIDVGTDGVMAFGNDAASQGSFVDQVTFTPNSTVTDGTVAVKGNLTVGNALTVTGTTTLNGNLVLGDAAADTLTVGATLQGASPLTFEGGTSDGYETTFAITDPTADRTITFPNLSGTVQLSGNPISGTTGTFTGTITGGTDGSGVDVVLYSGTAGDNLTWDASEEVLIITGTNGATSLNVADGNVTIADDLAVDGTSNLDNTDIDGTLVVDGSNISLDSTSTLNIDNSNTSNGITIGTATSGVPISIGHSTSETTINDNLTVTGTVDIGGGAIDGTTIGASSAAAGTFAAIAGTTGTFSGVVDITDATDSSDASGDTGALRTEGGASIAKKLYVGDDVAVTGSMTITETATTGPTITLKNPDTEFTDNQQGGSISFVTTDDSGTGEASAIRAIGDGTTGMTSIAFYSGTVGSTVQRMHIDGSTGYVGIGMASGGSEVNTEKTFTVTNNIGTDQAFISFRDNAGSNRLFDFVEGSSNDGYMRIKDGGSTKASLKALGDSYFNGGGLGIQTSTISNSGLTVGANTDGYDVLFYGNSSGKYMLWDESEDTLQVEGKFTAIGGSEVSNVLVDTHADFLFNDGEARIQIAADDNGSNAASIILTNVVGANDNNNWVIAHKGPSASNDFRIGYRESTSSEDIVANASNRLAITTAGAVTFYGAVDLQANTLTTTGSIQGRTIDYSDGDLAMTIGDGGTVTFDDRVTVGDVDLDYYRFLVRSAWTSGGSWNRAASLAVGADLTGHSGDDAFLTHALMGDEAGGSIVLGRDVTTVATLYLSEPDINVNGNTLTNSATLYIQDAASEATNNYALWVDNGYSRFDSHVGIGDTSPTEAELVIRNADNAAHTLIYTSDSGTGNHTHWDIRNGGDTQVGTVNTNGSTTTYATSSDYRLKENIVNLTGAIDRVKELKPKRFNFKADATVTLDGFLAHEAAEVVPISVTGTKDEMNGSDPVYQGMDASKLVPLLTAAIKELDSRVTALE